MTTNEGIMHLFLPFMDTLKPLPGSESEVSKWYLSRELPDLSEFSEKKKLGPKKEIWK